MSQTRYFSTRGGAETLSFDEVSCPHSRRIADSFDAAVTTSGNTFITPRKTTELTVTRPS